MSVAEAQVEDTLRILIVEDNAADAELTRIMLQDAGFRVAAGFAGSVDEARAKLVRPCPDVIMLDLGLPGCTGVEALQAVAPACPESSIVVVTGSDDEAVMLETAEYAVHDFIRKDQLSPARLRWTIRSAIRQKEKVQKDKDLAVLAAEVRGHLARADDVNRRIETELRR